MIADFFCMVKSESRLVPPKYKIVNWNGKFDGIVITLLKYSKTYYCKFYCCLYNKMPFNKRLLILIPPLLYTFTRLWNAVVFPSFHIDGGVYIRRAMYTLNGSSTIFPENIKKIFCRGYLRKF
jgi:hypothetical protein